MQVTQRRHNWRPDARERITRCAALLIFCVVGAGLLIAQEQVDSEAYGKIRHEATERSKVMWVEHMLTDRYGPRLTGSPNYEAAAKWAVATMTQWGLKNAHLEPWDFGHPGWSNERAQAYMVLPVRSRLTFEVLAWTPSTHGDVTASAVQLVVPQRPLREDVVAWMDANHRKVKGKIVLIGKAAVLPVNFEPPGSKRMTDAQAQESYGPQSPNAQQPPAAPAGPRTQPRQDRPLTARQLDELLDPWLLANGALIRVKDAGLRFGLVRAQPNLSYDIGKAVPTVVLRNEDYGRIERLLGDGADVQLEFNIANNTYPAGKTSYNVIAEIPGTDKADEIVMIGAHLDSWHAATGATDNAAGASTMMEAARLIQALGLRPRRTIRIALWSGEEQAYALGGSDVCCAGSATYVKKHFGTAEQPKAEFEKLVVYLNSDYGGGRVRGANVFGPPEAADELRAALDPFQEIGVVGARATSFRSITLAGSDSASFKTAGLTSVSFGRDPIEYENPSFPATWHTNIDTYERVVPDDMKNASIVVASVVWHLANRRERLSAFRKENMPLPQ